MWDRIFKALQKYGLQARDARINAIGVDNIRDLHKDGKTEEANKLTNDLYKANIAGINFATGFSAKPLINASVSTASTLAEAPLNSGETIVKDLAINTGLEALGYGLTKLPIKFKSLKYSSNVNKSDQIGPYLKIDENGNRIIDTDAANKTITQALNRARFYFNSEAYAKHLSRNKELYERIFKREFTPSNSKINIEINPKSVSAADLPNTKGGHILLTPSRPQDDIIEINANLASKSSFGNSAYHEYIHHARFGVPHRPEIVTTDYNLQHLVPMKNYFNWKNKKLFIDPALIQDPKLKDDYKYLISFPSDANEGLTNLLELGSRFGIKPGTPYPGKNEVARILSQGNSEKQFVIDLLNKNKPKRIWDAMTGVYENGGSLLDKRYVKPNKHNSHFKSVKLDITKIKTNSKPEWVESFD